MKTSIFDMTFTLPPLIEMYEVEKEMRRKTKEKGETERHRDRQTERQTHTHMYLVLLGYILKFFNGTGP